MRKLQTSIMRRVLQVAWILGAIVSSETSIASAITLRALPIPPGESGVQFPAWSPDGTRVAGSWWSEPDGSLTERLFVLDVATEASLPIGGLAALAAQTTGHIAMMPSWSPDGLSLAVVADFYLWDVSIPDSTARLVNPDTVTNPAWSPDGQSIAYDGANGITVVPAQAGLPRRRLTVGADRNPDWSPSGSLVAFDRNDGAERNLWTVPAAGGPPRQLTFNSPLDMQPSWSPDGAFIVFASNRGGQRDLWIVRVADGELYPVTTNPANESAPDWSPDGLHIVFVSNVDGPERMWIAGDLSTVGVTPKTWSGVKNKFR